MSSIPEAAKRQHSFRIFLGSQSQLPKLPNHSADVENPPLLKAGTSPKSADKEGLTNAEEGLAESDPFWPEYIKEAEKFDESLIKEWNQDLESLLIFAGLFSGVLTAFIIESRKGLQEDLQAETNVILRQILDRLTPGQDQGPSSIQAEQGITWVVTFVNGVWFVSLIASLASAMGAILGKEWVREYSKTISQSGVAKIDARRRQYRYEGIASWQLSTALSAIPVLLHIAVLLFLIGLVVFLWADSRPIAWTLLAPICVSILIYFVATILPLIHHCPYRTPFTTLLMNLSKLLPKFFRQYVQYPTKFQTPADDDDNLDASALAWFLTTASNPETVVTAVKSVARLKGTPTQQLRILKEGGGHVIAGLVRSSFILEPQRTLIAPTAKLDDLASFMHAIEKAYYRPLQGIEPLGGRGLPKLCDMLRLVFWEEDELGRNTGILGRPDGFSLKCNIILAYAYIALQRHVRSRTHEYFSLAEPISKLLALWPNIGPDAHLGDPMKLRIIRALASLGAEDAVVWWWSKTKMFDVFSEVLQSSPFPPLELLQEALLGMKGLLYRQLSNFTFPLDSTPGAILNILTNLLQSLPSHPILNRPSIHQVLLQLIGRLKRTTFLSNCGVEPLQSLSTILQPFLKSDDDVRYCYSVVALFSLQPQIEIPPQRSTRIITRLIEDDQIRNDDFARMFRVISSQLFALSEDQTQNSILINRCCDILSTASSPFTSQGSIIRGLSALDFQRSSAVGNLGIIGAVVAFLDVAGAHDHIPENMDLALDLIRTIITSYPETSFSLFVNSKGFNMLQMIISVPVPLPRPVSTALMSTIYSIVNRVLSSSNEQQLQELATELNITEIFSKIRFRPGLFAQVKDSIEWLTMLTDLTERINGRFSMMGRQPLLEGLLQAYDPTSKGEDYRVQIDRLRLLDEELVRANLKSSRPRE